MLSKAKHLCSFSYVIEMKETAEILRCAQDDRHWFFYTFGERREERPALPCSLFPIPCSLSYAAQAAMNNV
jgi:hypothetical protein